MVVGIIKDTNIDYVAEARNITDRQHALQLPVTGPWRYPAMRLSLYAALVALIFIFAGEVQTFIYFQF